MKKTKLLNTSVVDNTGARIQPSVVIGEYNGHVSGDILDANATSSLIDEKIEGIDIEALSTLQEDVDNIKEVLGTDSEDLTDTIDTFNEIQQFLSGVDNTTTLNQILNGKQNTLVSGQTVKTINNQSVLGSGDIAIDDSFVVTFSMDPQTYTITCDKTIAEIFAVADNKPIVAIYSISGYNNVTIPNCMCYMYSNNTSVVVFSGLFNNIDVELNTINSTAAAVLVGVNNGTNDTWTTLNHDLNGIQEVYHGTGDLTFALTPNIYHSWHIVSNLTLTFGTPRSNFLNEYMFEFISGSTPTTLSLPNSFKWADSCGELSVEADKIYLISIVNEIGVWCSADRI